MARSSEPPEGHWLTRYFTCATILFSIHLAPVLRKKTGRESERISDDGLPVRSMKPKKTILCVDDNEQSLSIRKILLETRGYRVLAFSSGAEALERFKRGGVDLVLTDLIMPGFDGTKLIEEVKALSPETPTIL